MQSTLAPSTDHPIAATLRPRTLRLGVLACTAVLMASCGSSPAPPPSATASGTLHVAGDLPSAGFLVESNQAGEADQLGLEGVYWGRLVDVLDIDGVLRHRDFVIGDDIVSDGFEFELGVDALGERSTLRILHPFASATYVTALQRAQRNLTPVRPKGTGPAELPPFSVVPRNAALVVRFDDLLDARFVAGAWRDGQDQLLVSQTTGQLKGHVVRLVSGSPPVLPIEARVFVSSNHGDLRDDGSGPAFHPTRLIVAPTISESEAAASDPPLPVQPLGLPAGSSELEANVVLRIPTRLAPAVGQHAILTNPRNRGLAYVGERGAEPVSVTRDLERAFASGSGNQINAGLLFDNLPPLVLSNLAVVLEDDDPNDAIPAVTDLGGGLFEVRQVRFLASNCAAILKPNRDVLVQGAMRALVVGAQQSGGLLQNVVLEVLAPPGGAPVVGAARYQSPFVAGSDPPACFLRFSFEPQSPPDQGVSKAAHVIVRFSKAMDPASVSSFDNLLVTRRRSDSPALTNFDYVVGRVRHSPDLREFAFAPARLFDRSQGFSESDVPAPGTYHFTLLGGAQGPTDLAGNPMNLGALRVPFLLDPSEPVSVNGGVVLRFDSQNEIHFNPDDEAQGWGELRAGQIQIDTGNSTLLPRPVNRFSFAADRDKPVPSIMSPFPPGVQTPLSPLGSKLQSLWRYVDLGWSLLDESYINVDVESLAWAPVGGGVVADSYDEFSIRLGHSKWLPDETPDPQTLFPEFPLSGLVKTYADNYLNATPDQGTIVHPQQSGYSVNPANNYTASSGTLMQPFPLNRGIPISQYRHYTWRDTAVLEKGGANSAGAILKIESLVLTGGTAPAGVPYGPGSVPTIGLPLLMEYRCYPDSGALGLNAFDVSLAINSSARPNFRAFSTGGLDANSNPVIKDPDLETTATGGFNPGFPGQPTMGTDNVSYIGEVGLVTRVSRTHSVWLDTGFSQPRYVRPVLEPEPHQQPGGTQVLIAYRGATAVSAGATSDNVLTNAARLDPYGDPLGAGVGAPTFPAGNPQGEWSDAIQGIDANRFFQFRLTFISNAATLETASLASLGFAYEP